jgi:RimJ/RimL family protein N-acetyltransferase
MPTLQRKIAKRLSTGPQFEWLLIVSKKLNGSLPVYEAQVPFKFEVLPQDPEEIEARLVPVPKEHRPDIEWRVKNGDRCFVAKQNGQITFVAWAAFGKCYSYLLDREFRLADREAYGYGAYTLPRFRGNGLHPAATCHRLQFLREQGCERYVAFVEPGNHAAMRMPEKLGLEKVGVTGFIELFGLRWYFHRDRGALSALARRQYWRKM